jgi:hypothetical protein
MIGAAALVPANSCQPVSPNVSYTATPVAGSATADTSAMARLLHRVSGGPICQPGCGSKAEQPEPAPPHACSVKRVVVPRIKEVPPTATTYGDAAG